MTDPIKEIREYSDGHSSGPDYLGNGYPSAPKHVRVLLREVDRLRTALAEAKKAAAKRLRELDRVLDEVSVYAEDWMMVHEVVRAAVAGLQEIGREQANATAEAEAKLAAVTAERDEAVRSREVMRDSHRAMRGMWKEAESALARALEAMPNEDVTSSIRHLVGDRTGGAPVPYAPWDRVLDALDRLDAFRASEAATSDPDARRTVAATGVDGNGTGKGGEHGE